MSEHREWREGITERWLIWHPVVDERGAEKLPLQLEFPEAKWERKQKAAAADSPSVNGSNGQQMTADEWILRSDLWIGEAVLWACRRRGLGDYPRFALMRYLAIEKPMESLEPEELGRLKVKEWLYYVNKNSLTMQQSRNRAHAFGKKLPRHVHRLRMASMI